MSSEQSRVSATWPFIFHSIPLKKGCQIQGKSGIERIICVGECLGPFKAVNAQTSALKVFSKS